MLVPRLIAGSGPRRFLSLFAGVGRVGEQFAKRGVISYLLDLTDNPRNDLSKNKAMAELRNVYNDFDVLGVELERSTWSRARRAPAWSSWPSPLRTPGRYLFGVPSLSAAEALRVKKSEHNV